MDIRKMKLALTVDLMNFPGSNEPVDFAQSILSNYESEMGTFKGVSESTATNIGVGMERKIYALHFEKATFDLDLVTNENSKEQLIQGFNLTENYA